MWERCVTGSYDYCDEDDDAIFHIFRTNLLGKEKYAGQVFVKDSDKAQLIYEKSLPLFITKCVVKANEFGWRVDFSMIDLNPDLKSLPKYESNIYKEHYEKDFEALDDGGKQRFCLAGIGSEPIV